MKKLIIALTLCFGFAIFWMAREIARPEHPVIEEREFYIKFYANKYQLDPDLLYALAYNEAYYIKVKIQNERRLRKEKWYLRQIKDSPWKEDPLAFCSLGDLQVLYGTAWIQGFKYPPAMLIEPRYCIEQACIFLAHQFKFRKNLNDIIACYSQGHPYRNKAEYWNKDTYVYKVRATYIKLKLKRSKKK